MSKLVRTALICYLLISKSAFAETVSIATIDWCPFVCPHSQKNPGVLVEYTSEIFLRAGIDVEYQVVPWSRAIHMTRKGDYDGLLSPAKNEAPGFVFPDTKVGEQRFCYFIRDTDTWQYKDQGSLTKRKILYAQDALPPYLTSSKDKLDLEVLPYNKTFLRQATDMLAADRIDTVIFTYFSTYDFLNKNDLNNSISNAGCIPATNLYLAFSPGESISERINMLVLIFEREIKMLKEENFYESLLVKYGLHS